MANHRFCWSKLIFETTVLTRATPILTRATPILTHANDQIQKAVFFSDLNLGPETTKNKWLLCLTAVLDSLRPKLAGPGWLTGKQQNLHGRDVLTAGKMTCSPA